MPLPTEHNPERVPPGVLGKGWRFLYISELGNPPRDAELFAGFGGWTLRGSPGTPANLAYTYRTRHKVPVSNVISKSAGDQFPQITAAIRRAQGEIQ